MDKLYTIKEIASVLNVPESTLRYYRDRFEEFIPYVGKGRKRRYKKEALAIFRLIIDGYEQDLSFKQIKSQLLHTISKTEIKGGLDQDLTERILQKQGEILEILAKDLSKKKDIYNHINELEARLKKIEQGLLRLAKDYSLFKRQLDGKLDELANHKEVKNGE